MAKITRRNFGTPTNSDCRNQETTSIELRQGSECERSETGNSDITDPDTPDGYEDCPPTSGSSEDEEGKCSNGDVSGYHRYTMAEVFTGVTVDGKCPSPYSRSVMSEGITNVTRDREELLLDVTGRPTVLLRRQATGPRCPCYSPNRGRSKKRCPVCYGVGFTPGYIPYQNQKDPLGRIKVRFAPMTESLAMKEQGLFQEINVEAWTLSHPIVAQRDILIVYDTSGREEYRYEIKTVTRNSLFGEESGAQKFNVMRLDPATFIYRLDPFKIPDLADIAVDVSEHNPLIEETMYEGLGIEDDGEFNNIVIEGPYGDGAFSGMYAEGYKNGYETNYKRALEFKQTMMYVDFEEDGEVTDGYGPVFHDTNGNHIRFSTPQKYHDNAGIAIPEVIAADAKRYYLNGWVVGAKAGWLDAQNELRARGLL